MMIRTIKLVLGGLAVALVALAAVLAWNTWQTPSMQLTVPPLAPVPVDADRAAERVARAVQFRTLSLDGAPQSSASALQAFRAWLRDTYPAVHATLTREVVAGHSLLFTWQGSDPALAPVLLMAHQDVVPIAPGTQADWSEPPFAGVRKDGYIWGRGAWDDKGNLIAQLEAVDALISRGFVPRRTIHLAFGHDEEIGGQGARAIAALLRSRGVRLHFVLDEGLLITEGILPGLSQPVALIGIAEKGYLSLDLAVKATPGHSSMPPTPGQGAIAMMSAALGAIENQQLPSSMRGVARELFDTLAPEMAGVMKVALTNLWLFEPLVRAQLVKGASTNALLRTTTALTVVRAGDKENVLPGLAQATVNFRLLPGDTMAAVQAHVGTAVANPAITVTARAGGAEASIVSPTGGDPYRLIARTVRELFPGTVVAPGLMIGATDSRHFQSISDHIFRFSPVRATAADLTRFHGTDERIAEDNLVELIRFYQRLLTMGTGPVAG